MDDSEYYSMMRRQYSHSEVKVPKKAGTDKTVQNEPQTPGTFGEWTKNYGHEDAEMFMERNQDSQDSQNDSASE